MNLNKRLSKLENRQPPSDETIQFVSGLQDKLVQDIIRDNPELEGLSWDEIRNAIITRYIHKYGKLILLTGQDLDEI